MEFHEKLQELRKREHLTQEELAQALFVSRTAISKWESGRGFPSIDSLKAISKYFKISLDDLLSGQELLTIAEEDSKTQKQKLQRLIFSLLDCALVLLLFLPCFGQTVAGSVQAVSLLQLTLPPYLTVSYYALIIGHILLGIFGFVSSMLWNIKRPTIGYAAGVEVEIWKIGISARYNGSFKKSEVLGYSTGSNRINTIQLGLGFYF